GSVGRAALERQPIQIPDVLADPEYKMSDNQRIGNIRTALSVPLVRDGIAVAVLSLIRMKVHPFTEKEIQIVRTFANQALIAIENTRLFEEVQARTRELSESLEQHIATSNVLSVISRSPGDLEPVFAAMLQNAVRICDAKFGTLGLYDGDPFQNVTLINVPAADVLKVISRSALDLQKVLDALVESAARLCDADDATLFRVVGHSGRLVARD